MILSKAERVRLVEVERGVVMRSSRGATRDGYRKMDKFWIWRSRKTFVYRRGLGFSSLVLFTTRTK